MITTKTPLSTLLSQALIAFTIEFDNEWEKRLLSTGPLKIVRTSMVMWANFMRFVSEDGITIQQLSEQAGYPKSKTHPSLSGMTRWRYVTITPDNPDANLKRPKPNWHIYPTEMGLQAAAIWKPLFAEIEQNWESRFGKVEITNLRNSLIALINQFDRKLPHYFSVLYPRDGMRAVIPDTPDSDAPADLNLPSLLSQATHAFTLDFEQNTKLSLALRANVIRVLNRDGLRVRDLPRLSGISKEAIAMASRFLQKTGHIEIVPDPTATRGKVMRLTAMGKTVQDEYHALLNACEQQWAQKYGVQTINNLRNSLEPLVEAPIGQPSPLFKGLIPHPSVWRAQVPKPDLIPHHPMVLHRGGWPDGS